MGFRKEYPEGFEEVWKIYPNKANKHGAYKFWLREGFADPEENALLLEHIAERAITDLKWMPNERGETFIPHLQTFINQRRWEDEYPRVPSRKPDRYELANEENERRRQSDSAFVPH